MTKAAVTIARQLDVSYICAFTQSGDSARRLSRLRPAHPILAFTPEPRLPAFLSLLWGVEPIQVEMVDHTDAMTRQVDRYLQEEGRAGKDDMVVICAGSPPGVAGSTNLVKVHRVGDLADAGEVVGRQGRRERVGPWRES